MRSLDASFLIDLLRGDPAAVEKADALDRAGERMSIAAPALAEVLVGAYYKGGADLTRTLETLASLDVPNPVSLALESAAILDDATIASRLEAIARRADR